MSVSIKGSRTIVGSGVSAKTIVLRRCFTPNNVNTVEDRDKPAKRGETEGTLLDISVATIKNQEQHDDEYKW